MQTKDLTVGGVYAFRDRSYSSVQKAVVLEMGVEIKGRRSSKSVLNGVRVTLTQHRSEETYETVVKPQQLRETWEAHEAHEEARAKSAVASAEYKAALYRKRADQAFALHEALVAKGVEPRSAYCYDDDARVALDAAGFRVSSHAGAGVFGRGDYVSAVNSLSEVVTKGLVSLDAVALVLGLSDEKPEVD